MRMNVPFVFQREMRMMKRFTPPSVLCIVLLCVSASADDYSSQAKLDPSPMDAANKQFKALDHNHDRHISLDEAHKDPELLKRFASADTNGDGQLDQAEFMSKPSERPGD